MTILGDIPKGWAVTSVGEVAKYQNGRAFKPSEWGKSGLPIIRIQNLNDAGAVFNFSDQPHEERFRVNHGDLLYAWSASLGAYIWKGQEAWLNQHIFRVDHTPGIDRIFLYFALKNITSELYTKAHGSGMVHVTKAKFEETTLWLPPLNEQRRIVAKIDELFSELDKGVESLETARAQLKVYRQAMLKNAFEGKLTAQWREENREKLETAEQLLTCIGQEREAAYQVLLEEWESSLINWKQNGKKGKKPARPRKNKILQPFNLEELDKLPDIDSASWKWIKIDEICSYAQYSIKAGPFGSALKKQFLIPDGYKVYGQEQVISGDPYFGDYFVDATKYEELSTCRIAPRDVLISLVGTVGKVLILPDDCSEGIINPRLVKVSLNLRYYRPEFFKYFFESAFVRRLCQNLATGTTMDVLNLGIIRNLPFPLCSLPEQDKLILEIESKLSVADQIEKEIEAGLIKVEALRQSILKKAFLGELVDQDSNDEPAAALLGRIKTVKASQRPRNKTHKREVANA